MSARVLWSLTVLHLHLTYTYTYRWMVVRQQLRRNLRYCCYSDAQSFLHPCPGHWPVHCWSSTHRKRNRTREGSATWMGGWRQRGEAGRGGGEGRQGGEAVMGGIEGRQGGPFGYWISPPLSWAALPLCLFIFLLSRIHLIGKIFSWQPHLVGELWERCQPAHFPVPLERRPAIQTLCVLICPLPLRHRKPPFGKSSGTTFRLIH